MKIRTLLLTLLITTALTNARAVSEFYVDYSDSPSASALQAYPLSIINHTAKADLAAPHALGHKVLAYLSLCELPPGASYRSQTKVTFLGKNPVWKSDYVDVSSPEWHHFLIDQLALEAVQKGFDGFFLDTADSLENLIKIQPAREAQFRESLIHLIRDLRKKYPDKQIVINRGFAILKDILPSVDGVLVESLFQTYDTDKKTYGPVSAEDQAWILNQLQPALDAKKSIYILDYVDPKDEATAFATAAKIREKGFAAFISTPELEGQSLAPLRLMPRKILALYGNNPAQNGELAIRWPSETMVVRTLQMPLEYLGYEVEYQNAFQQIPKNDLGPDYAAVLIGIDLSIHPRDEAALVTWLLAQKAHGKKLLLFSSEGGFIVTNPFEQNRLARGLGLELGKHPLPATTHTYSKIDEGMMNFEAKVHPTDSPLIQISSKGKNTVYLAVQAGPDTSSEEVFTADWGCFATEPYIFFQRPDNEPLWLLDPFRFLSQALGTPAWPAPDTTTQQGCRILFSHVDADGFSSLSFVQKGKTAAEVIRDFILQRYPIPFTTSVIESEIEGLLKGQKVEDKERLTGIAKSIFALPQVHPASHSYSHPYAWIQGDVGSAVYEQPNLSLAQPLNGWISPDREVAGSSRYIDNTLLPAGKKVEIMLWSGNCRPGPDALKSARLAGIENMNGGETLITHAIPSVTSISPKCVPWGDELQIFAPNQNDNIYTSGLQADSIGGFVNVINTFEMTENGRRLKPVNIYFHYFSGVFDASLNALTKVLDWATHQKLHAMTASDYARMVRGTRDSQLFRRDDGSWIILAGEAARTFRLPAQGRFPVMGESQGVIGYNTFQNNLYIHTDGSRYVRVILSPNPPKHLFLDSSTGELTFSHLETKAADFSVKDLRPIEVILGGLESYAKVSWTCNSVRTDTRADSTGTIHLHLPPEAAVHLTTE